MTTQTLANYLSRIPPEHAGQPNFIATLSLVLQPFVDAQNLLQSIPQAYDIDYAVGAQLNVVGQWVGRSRQLAIPLQTLWFTWDDPLRGWDIGYWYNANFNPGVTYTYMDDDAYRRLLKAVAIANEWDGTVPGGAPVLNQFFSDNPATYPFIQDDGYALETGATVASPRMTIAVSGDWPSIVDLCVLTQDLLGLRPGGVAVDYLVTSVSGTPCFGFDVENEYISGWDAGSWAVSPEFILSQDQSLLTAP